MAHTESARSVPNAKHVHDFVTVVDDGSITTTSFASSVYSATVVGLTPDDTADGGVAATIARSDHRHAAPCAVPVAVGTTLAEGNSTSLSRANHVHELGAGSIDTASQFAAGVVDNAALGAGAVTPQKTTVNFARVRRAANQALAINTAADISFDTEDEDTGGWWTAGTPTRFTVPAGQAGVVNVTCNAFFTANGSGRRVLLIVHNLFTIVAGHTTNAIGTDPTRLSASTGPMRVAVADVFTFSVLHQSTIGLNIIDRTSATIEWLGV